MITFTRVASINKYFASLKDPRVRNRTQHRLIDIVAVALCGVIANCDTWAEIVDFGNTHTTWGSRSSTDNSKPISMPIVADRVEARRALPDGIHRGRVREPSEGSRLKAASPTS